MLIRKKRHKKGKIGRNRITPIFKKYTPWSVIDMIIEDIIVFAKRKGR